MLSSLQRPNKMVEKKFEHLLSPWCGPCTQSPLRACSKRAHHSRTAGKNLESWTWTHGTWLEPGPMHHLHTPRGCRETTPRQGLQGAVFPKGSPAPSRPRSQQPASLPGWPQSSPLVSASLRAGATEVPSCWIGVGRVGKPLILAKNLI